MGNGGILTATTVGTRLEELIKAQAYGIGFDLAGITTLGPAETANAFEEWIARGYAGEMEYLPRGAAKRRDTRSPLDSTTAVPVRRAPLRATREGTTITS